MLDSVKIQRRQSEIRQALAELVAKDAPTEDETRSMDEMDREYRSNETRYRAALIAEDDERREAGEELETRSDREWAELMGKFELRQAAVHLDEGTAMTGQTKEVVDELRAKGGYQGVPVPLEALETRAGETVAAGTPDPIRTRPIIERLFANSVAGLMGGQAVNVGIGELEYPVATSKVTAGWTADELGDVPPPTEYATIDRPLKPDHNLGVQMSISRKAMKQSGAGLELAIRRDMSGAISEELDKAVFQADGTAGTPLGLFPGAATYGITETAVGAAAQWSVFRAQVTEFMLGNAANGPGSVRLLVRPEVWDALDDQVLTGTGITEWDRLTSNMGAVHMTNNALAAPAGGATSAIMTTNAGGVPPFYMGLWGAVDLIRDNITKAASGQLLLTAIMTADITVSRSVQTRIMTDIQ